MEKKNLLSTRRCHFTDSNCSTIPSRRKIKELHTQKHYAKTVENIFGYRIQFNAQGSQGKNFSILVSAFSL